VCSRGRDGTISCTFEGWEIAIPGDKPINFVHKNSKIPTMPVRFVLLARLLLLMKTKEILYSFLLKKKPAFHPKVGFFG